MFPFRPACRRRDSARPASRIDLQALVAIRGEEERVDSDWEPFSLKTPESPAAIPNPAFLAIAER